ncbi:MAG: hypothetical protein GX205_02875 [Firmicutes bacterium]|nr:hypothetical protein [Bacillota bacterium]
MKKRILYIGWVGFGNHGDDICRDVFIRRFKDRAAEASIDLEVTALFPSAFDELALARLRPDLVVLGAGSLFELIYLKPLVLAQQYGIPTAIWGSGVDGLSAEPDVPHDLAYAIRQVVNQAGAIGLRGPYTRMVLEKVGAAHPYLMVTGDPGLLWEKKTHGEANPPSGSPRTIAINWGTARNNVMGGDERQVADALAQFLQNIKKQYQLLIYPMWHADLEPCLRLADMVGSRDVCVLEEVPSPEELMAIYEKSVCSINMKLHANIFSAAAGCPFISLAYRWKCIDFAQSVECDEWVLPFSEPGLAAKLQRSFDKLLSTRDSVREHLKTQVNQAREKLGQLENEIWGLLQ